MLEVEDPPKIQAVEPMTFDELYPPRPKRSPSAKEPPKSKDMRNLKDLVEEAARKPLPQSEDSDNASCQKLPRLYLCLCYLYIYFSFLLENGFC